MAEGSCGVVFTTVFWILAVILVVGGIVMLVRRAVIYGVALLVVGFMGPGGVAIVC